MKKVPVIGCPGSGKSSFARRLREETGLPLYYPDLPTETCLAGTMARIGVQREDLPWVETSFDEEFRQQIADFPAKELPELYRLLEAHGDKQTVIFKSHADINHYFCAKKQ